MATVKAMACERPGFAESIIFYNFLLSQRQIHESFFFFFCLGNLFFHIFFGVSPVAKISRRRSFRASCVAARTASASMTAASRSRRVRSPPRGSWHIATSRKFSEFPIVLSRHSLRYLYYSISIYVFTYIYIYISICIYIYIYIYIIIYLYIYISI